MLCTYTVMYMSFCILIPSYYSAVLTTRFGTTSAINLTDQHTYYGSFDTEVEHTGIWYSIRVLKEAWHLHISTLKDIRNLQIEGHERSKLNWNKINSGLIFCLWTVNGTPMFRTLIPDSSVVAEQEQRGNFKTFILYIRLFQLDQTIFSLIMISLLG